MLKVLIATCAVAASTLVIQSPAEAWCMDSAYETAAECRSRSRIERLERQQRQDRYDRDCRNGGAWSQEGYRLPC